MFKEVSGVGHIEPFLATSQMKLDDCVLLYVGTQRRDYEPGVYAVGKIVKEPYIVRNHPEYYCNNKLSMDVEILKISNLPLMTKDEFKKYNNFYRRVHKLNSDYYSELAKQLDLHSIMNK
jgi:hypothetical protein